MDLAATVATLIRHGWTYRRYGTLHCFDRSGESLDIVRRPGGGYSVFRDDDRHDVATEGELSAHLHETLHVQDGLRPAKTSGTVDA